MSFTRDKHADKTIGLDVVLPGAAPELAPTGGQNLIQAVAYFLSKTKNQ